MNTPLVLVVSLVVGYLLGGVPFASMVARLRGIDIMKVGTGNPGSANVFRSVGTAEGVLVGFLDMGKGALAVQVGQWLGLAPDVALAGGAAAVVGHCHSPFLRLRGGSGLATAVGVGLRVFPLVGGIGVVVAVAFTLWHRNVGVGAGVGYVAAFFTGLGLQRPLLLLIGAIALAAAVLVRSRVVDLLAERRLRRAPPVDGREEP